MYILKVYVILYTEIKQICKKNSLDKINGTKNALFFLSRGPKIAVLLLIWDSYISWSTSFVSQKLCVGFYIFDSVSFLWKFIFFFKAWTLWLWNVIIPFKIKLIEKPHTFCSGSSDFYVAARSFKIQW